MNTKNKLVLILSFMFTSIGISIGQINEIRIVPQPAEIKTGSGSFTLSSETRILVSSPNQDLVTIVTFLNQKLKKATGFEIGIISQPVKQDFISLKLDASKEMNAEGYSLTVSKKNISIEAKTARGAFYAVQTLLQLLPPEIESKSVTKASWNIPCVAITDYPRFVYRGMHLDVCRHFFPVEFVKKQLDIMAMYKLNTFHWHLTEDQGWRIEIKKYPKLTEIGSKRIEGEGNEYGGFYTQEQIKEVVQYAKDRFINVIPEIELPGHALAALTAYPQYSCTGGPFKVRNIWGVEPDVYCAGKEETFQFVDDIINEVVALFPYEYFHIGGDECPKTRWKVCPQCQARIKNEGLKDEHELQSYFVKRVEKTLTKLGKKMIGWDEILEGGLAPSATVMSWRGEEGGIAAANQDHDVVMTPGNWVYLDHYQGSTKVEPVEIGGMTLLSESYDYDPIPQKLPAEKHHFVLGTQGNVWSEYMYTEKDVEYQVYPRIIALAEVNWTQKSRKNFDDFVKRMDNQYPRLDFNKVNYHIPLPEGPANLVAFIDTVTLFFTTTRPVKMVYTLDGSEPGLKSPEYTKGIFLKESKIIKIRSVLAGGQMSKVRTISAEKQNPLPAKSVTTQPGVNVKRISGNFLRVADLDKVSQWNDTIVQDIRLKFDVKNPSAAVFTGYIDIPTTGVYFFSVDMDQLYIDGKLVVNNDGEVKRSSRNDGSIALSRGKHEFKLVFLNNLIGGWPSSWNPIKITYRSSTDVRFKPVGNEMLSH